MLNAVGQRVPDGAFIQLRICPPRSGQVGTEPRQKRVTDLSPRRRLDNSISLRMHGAEITNSKGVVLHIGQTEVTKRGEIEATGEEAENVLVRSIFSPVGR
jgi:hypothetical protein